MRVLKRIFAVGLVAAVAAPVMAAPPAAAGGRHHRPIVLFGAGTPTAKGWGGAFRYDATAVPTGATVSVLSVSKKDTDSWFVVTGLRPNWTYMAHLHQNRCTTVPSDAGPHYQQVPSTDPADVNPVNEVWLNVTTNAYGAGTSTSVNPWRYRAFPGSLVLHAGHPKDNPAGAPIPPSTFVACLSLSGF